MRESYRLNKHTVGGQSNESRAALDIVFMYAGSQSALAGKMALRTVEAAIRKLTLMISKASSE